MLGSGVPFVFRGLPLRLGVASGSRRLATSSSSIDSFRGTVVVVVVAVAARREAGKGLGEGNKRRRVESVEATPCPSSVSTVTNSLCGDLLSPTSSSNVCFRGEPAREEKRPDRCWLRVTRCDDGGTMIVSLSLRGSGDDMMSALEVSGFAMECQRRLKVSEAVAAAAVVVIGGGIESRRLDICDSYRHGERECAVKH